MAGKPTVVQAGSWLAGQQARGSGETFADPPTLARAVRSISDNYAEFAAGARLAQVLWRRCHSPARLLEGLLLPAEEPRSDAA